MDSLARAGQAITEPLVKPPRRRVDGFHAHAGLMQYTPSGIFFARAKVDRIVKRASLDTDVFTTAKDRLRAKINELKAAKPNAIAETFKDAPMSVHWHVRLIIHEEI